MTYGLAVDSLFSRVCKFTLQILKWSKQFRQTEPMESVCITLYVVYVHLCLHFWNVMQTDLGRIHLRRLCRALYSGYHKYSLKRLSPVHLVVLLLQFQLSCLWLWNPDLFTGRANLSQTCCFRLSISTAPTVSNSE